ncbi:hypothetical protein BDZ89DRAFT_886648, partial [Hymenopellis radicata]
MKLIFKCLFGWDFDKRRSSLEGGILGHIEAFYSMDELTERGSYHRHCLLTMKGGLNPEELHRRMDDSDEFTTRFFAYVDGIIEHHLPENIPNVNAEEENVNVLVHEIEKDLKSMGECVQRHKHGPVCYKYGHEECRFSMPLPEVMESFYDKIKRCVVFKCRDGLMYFNRWILILGRFNHDLKCILSGKACKAAMFYITDYITKLSLKTYEVLSLLSDGVINANRSIAAVGANKLRAQVVLQKCLSQFARAQQVHAQHAARVIRGQPEVFSSHPTVAMKSGGMMYYIRTKWGYC